MKKILLSILSLLLIALPRLQAQNTFRNGDVLEMRLSGPPEEFTREFNIVLTVDEGTVNLPLIGRVAAAAPGCRPAAPEPWRRTQQKRLKRGASAQVIAELGAHREAPGVADENAPVRAAHRYLATGPAPSITPQPSPPDCPSAAASSSRDTITCSKRGSNFPPAPWFLGKRMRPSSSPLNRLPAR